MTLNPFERSAEEGSRAVRESQLSVGRVDTVDAESQTAVVRLVGTEAERCDIALGTSGDYLLPTPETAVVVDQKPDDRSLIVGVVYTNIEDVPNAELGERVIGHDSSKTKIHFQNDGSIVIQHDGGGIELQGPSNSEAKPIARKGDSVSVDGKSGEITSGSDTNSST